MGSRQVQPPTESSSSPPEAREPRDPEEAAAVAQAAPATSLPTLRPPTLEEPPPPPAAAGGPLVRARTGPLLPAFAGAAAHAQSPPSRDPPPSDTRPARNPPPSPSPREAREADSAGSGPQRGGGKRSASLAPPPAPLLIGCCQDPPRTPRPGPGRAPWEPQPLTRGALGAQGAAWC